LSRKVLSSFVNTWRLPEDKRKTLVEKKMVASLKERKEKEDG
jgi:hypothetical protein